MIEFYISPIAMTCQSIEYSPETDQVTVVFDKKDWDRLQCPNCSTEGVSQLICNTCGKVFNNHGKA